MGWVSITMSKCAAGTLDLIFPPCCEVCDVGLQEGREGALRWLCLDCLDAMPALEAPYCKVCGMPYEGEISDDFRCGNCADVKLHFDFAVSAFHAEGAVRHLVHRFKYQKELYLRGLLGNLLGDTLRRDARLKGLDPAQWLLVPVPLHRYRQWQRGFNQSWELCRELSRISGIPAVNGLRRTRNTSPQARLNRNARLANLKGSFRVGRRTWKWWQSVDFEGKNILLVDDVLTTGSTTSECAKVLRAEAGVQKVVVISLARG